MNSSVFHPPVPSILKNSMAADGNRESLARLIRERREHLNLTQTELAKLATVTQARISEIENGTRDFRIDTLAKVLDALGLKMTIAPNSPEEEFDLDKLVEEIAEMTSVEEPDLRPHANCYWIPDKPVVVGSYPGNSDVSKARKKIQDLLAAGADYFIDLTTVSDGVRSYEELLYELSPEKNVEYRSFPIEKSGVPSPEEMNRILDAIDAAVSAHHGIYLHCRGGIGRSGTVTGCYLVRHGMNGDEALAEVQRLFEQFSPKRVAAHPEGSPQHDNQRDMVRNWASFDRAPARFDIAVFSHDRHAGALVGLAAGDALGTTLEFTQHGSPRPIDDMVGGGPFHLEPGQWTDDTSMTLCLGESLVERHVFDAHDQMERYVRWWQSGHRSSNGKCFDIGNTVNRALRTFFKSGNAFAGSTDEFSAGNGSLMRLAPIAIFFSDDPELAIRMAGESSRTTHGSPVAVDACRYFAGLLVGAIRGERRETLLSPMYSPVPGLWEREPLRPEVVRVASGSFRKRTTPSEIAKPGYVINTLNLALWAFLHATDFRNGALAAVNIGGDADTTGAVYGQLAGAYFGLHAIPETWRNILAYGNEIEDMAYQLSWGPTNFPPVRRAEAAEEARLALAWAGGDRERAIARLDRTLDEMGYGGSLAGRAVVERAKSLLIQRLA
jgi:ADP-ribosylglycohydrolase/protein-tyrosine phosphatase/transcriptional regulator with XRE-family HTH domain